MPSKTTLFLFSGLAALIILGSIGYYNPRPETVAVNDGPDTSPPSDSATPVDDIAEKDTKSAQKIVENAMVEEKQGSGDSAPWDSNATAVSVPVPDLNRPLVFPGGYAAERAAQVTEQVVTIVAILKASDNRFNEWMDLAMLRKSIEDYDGAREIWEYVGAIRPGNSLSFANLGMLYGYYLNNPLKAEANLLHAIENEPRFFDFYTRMTDFYIEVTHDKNKSIDFLDRSIQKYPEWTELKDLKEHVAQTQ
ncbi:MAG: hypothetical protein A3D67_01630 [Candidatus Lloydbacteria bacterium RIFCSPHIGHO2_02_FULL_51_22]|uniref:Uncharacterized protein n=3 Tax=Candidatus Lloydiibacteriota TaxID=1817910 RepID=A0A1G2D6H0_9BACT|nr:MAG: hypothetical protein A3D67_01630 [Candidatus Lloydbacteria bacterium RIFCSPHIGHO2_02_FULL_51_22]OGZ15618.1 MAG: hypothetical protein A3J08_00265 [Candidatus Lloydbacteria bacterium RIFCSPLOWO2_02_FULL_51_11]OGZ16760.1 MAG: hypothetical protein A3G11_00555 [Candidatus Lloydbacteria bacterium RIFCSPLOWO2_12_FULL_51_9]